MKKIIICIILCITIITMWCREESYAANIKTLSWDLVDAGRHLDWGGSTKYMSQFKSAINIWNTYKKGVIRKDNLLRWKDVSVSDYSEISNVAGITSANGTIKINTYVMDDLCLIRRKNVFMHEIGHALGLAHNTKRDVMYAYVTKRTKLSNNDKKSYDYLYKKRYLR